MLMTEIKRESLGPVEFSEPVAAQERGKHE